MLLPLLVGSLSSPCFPHQYLCIAAGCFAGLAAYVVYYLSYLIPKIKRGFEPSPEKRLEPSILAAVFAPVGLFIFGESETHVLELEKVCKATAELTRDSTTAWSARVEAHWIGSAFGAGVFVAANYVTFQCLFLYIILAYDRYAASLLAANDFLRSFVRLQNHWEGRLGEPSLARS